MKQEVPKAGQIWEVLLDDGSIVNLRRRKYANIDGMWDMLDGSIIPCRVFGVRKKIINLNPKDAPIKCLCNKILLDTLHRNASAICIEPLKDNYIVMYKVDGIMKMEMQPKIALEPKLTARFKVMSGCDSFETKIPQAGDIELKMPSNKSICFRVNFTPTPYGEKIIFNKINKKKEASLII
jgi:type II secretory ATPase GspE/PulE/Tfp pilus assembly ATPase PilB-like protein